MKQLDPEHAFALKKTAVALAEAKDLAERIKENQNELWRVLLSVGVSKADIARCSNITPTAVNHRLKLINHGKG